MYYTVKDIAALANVTIKTLHHYHRIGLLVPRKISDAGYRLYGQEELERLQEILFFRELDFSLKDIREAMANSTNRTTTLMKQRSLLITRRGRLEQLIQ
ncbi:MAG TPA: MerR family transcriptional regulator, partial [Phototrophicaceae bacterium]|nr:MerR family transcriptional regulator [Phototrophicaceae bacterium]